MKTTKTILVNTFFNNSLTSRSSVKLLFEQISDVKNIKLDLQGIEFISRAAAHEFLVRIETCQNNGIDITLENVSNEVNRMFSHVSASRKSNAKKATFVKRIHFSSEKELVSYLETV